MAEDVYIEFMYGQSYLISPNDRYNNRVQYNQERRGTKVFRWPRRKKLKLLGRLK